MYIVLARTRGGVTAARNWGLYSEETRYKACQYARKYGWTVYYPSTTSGEDAIKSAVAKHKRVPC